MAWRCSCSRRGSAWALDGGRTRRRRDARSSGRIPAAVTVGQACNRSGTSQFSRCRGPPLLETAAFAAKMGLSLPPLRGEVRVFGQRVAVKTWSISRKTDQSPSGRNFAMPQFDQRHSKPPTARRCTSAPGFRTPRPRPPSSWHTTVQPSGRYARLGQRLCQEGYAVYIPDLRGHGRSEGPRAQIQTFADYLDDLNWLSGRRGERLARPAVFARP